MSVSMLNSQSDERSDQHTHILRQSLLDNSAATAGTTTASPVLSPLPVPSLLCRSPPPPIRRCCRWYGPCSLPAQLRLPPLCYICLTEQPLWRAGRERKRERAQNGREERKKQFPHRERERERDTGGGSVGSVSTLINITLYMYFLSSLKK